MALTPEKIESLIRQADDRAPKTGSIFRALVKLTEAEVRAQDTALIRQMLEAFKSSSPYGDSQYGWKDENWAVKRTSAISAAQDRLANLEN